MKKGKVGLLLLCLALLLAGCDSAEAGDSEETEAPTEAPEATEAPPEEDGADEEEDTAEDEAEDALYTDGSYTGTGEGYGGDLTVLVTIEDDQIADIEIGDNREDALYLEEAEAILPKIISAQSTDVDTVSGATLSCNGILQAVEDALGQAAA